MLSMAVPPLPISAGQREVLEVMAGRRYCRTVRSSRRRLCFWPRKAPRTKRSPYGARPRATRSVVGASGSSKPESRALAGLRPVGAASLRCPSRWSRRPCMTRCTRSPTMGRRVGGAAFPFVVAEPDRGLVLAAHEPASPQRHPHERRRGR